MKALVTGGGGFIGSHLVDTLVKKGYEVTVLDDFSTGRLKNVLPDEGIVLAEGSVLHEETVDRLCQGKDVVFHLAAQADIRESLTDHAADFNVNTLGTLNVLEAAYVNKVPDFIFTSSCAVYGEASVTPTPESYLGTQESLYSASKFAAESFGQAYTRFSPMKFWAFRFSNVIGSRCRRGVVWDFVNKLKADPNELEILGDGRQSKQYLHVSDCVDGILIGYTESKERVNTFNLATDENTSVDEVADIVTSALNLNPKRRHTGGRRGWIGDLPTVNLSIEKMRGLGWHPRVKPRDAIIDNVLWARSQEEILN